MNNEGKFLSAAGKSGTVTQQEKAELTSVPTEVASVKTFIQHRLEAFLTVPASVGECLDTGS